MKNLQKGNGIIIAIVLVAIVIVAFAIFTNKNEDAQQPTSQQQVNTPPALTDVTATSSANSPTTSELTVDQARALVFRDWGDCSEDRCNTVTVTVQKAASAFYVTALYEGLRDDSVAAEKRTANAFKVNGQWKLGSSTVTHRCQPNRGHQDFSTVPCI